MPSQRKAPERDRQGRVRGECVSSQGSAWRRVGPGLREERGCPPERDCAGAASLRRGRGSRRAAAPRDAAGGAAAWCRNGLRGARLPFAPLLSVGITARGIHAATGKLGKAENSGHASDCPALVCWSLARPERRRHTVSHGVGWGGSPPWLKGTRGLGGRSGHPQAPGSAALQDTPPSVD